MSAIISSQRIERHILLLRGQRVILSPHLAELYHVEPRTLIQAFKRNAERFPPDFMFQLTWEEAESLRSQFVILDVGPTSPQNPPSGAFDARSTPLRSQAVTLDAEDTRRSRSQPVILKEGQGRGRYSKYLPYAFTEQGVAMLSSVLRSRRAVQVNIAIMRAFVHLREILATHKDLARKLEELEAKYDKQSAIVFDAIRQLMAPPPEQPKTPIGFRTGEPEAPYRRRPPRRRASGSHSMTCLPES
ncbi:MAG: ORF6N domain-containing protein [Planctomycetes bacterium]|nr:ORF6N domain-containing protein [Planctomycetota bacterium]